MSFFGRTGPEPDNAFKQFMRRAVVVALVVVLAIFINRIYKDTESPKDSTPTTTTTP